jgi:PBSX family phage terminase large subunit
MKIRYGSRALRFAMRPLEMDLPINILEGAVRSGKTWCLHPKAIWACHYDVAGLRLFTGVSKQSVYNNVLKDLFTIVGPDNYKYNRTTGRLTLFDMEWLVIGARDEGSERYLRGMTVGIAICDEVSLMPHNFFEMLLTRMSPKGARLYATTNPDTPFHWLKTQYIDNAVLKANGTVWTRHFTMADNPNLTEEYINSQSQMYTGFFHMRFIEGLWVQAEGAIYRDSWSDDLLYDLKDQPVGLKGNGGFVQRIIAVDYGTANPMVFLDIYDDGKILWVTGEYYWDSVAEGRQKTDAEYADDLVRLIGPNDRGTKVIVDPSAASFKAEMSKRGIWHVDADHDVYEGIRMTSMVLSKRMIRFCRERTQRTVQELQSYTWDTKAAEQGEEKPLKSHDHGPDALRYFVKTLISYGRLEDY